MEHERAHDHHSTGSRGAIMLRLARHCATNLTAIQYPVMRLRNDSQWSLINATGVEAEPQGDHLLEQFHRRLHVNHPRFFRPRTEPHHLDSLTNCDGPILVPRHRPICIPGFVKEDRAYSH